MRFRSPLPPPRQQARMAQPRFLISFLPRSTNSTRSTWAHACKANDPVTAESGNAGAQAMGIDITVCGSCLFENKNKFAGAYPNPYKRRTPAPNQRQATASEVLGGLSLAQRGCSKTALRRLHGALRECEAHGLTATQRKRQAGGYCCCRRSSLPLPLT